MPARSHQIPGGARVWIFTCECGAPASFGEQSNLRAALETGDVARAGVWCCGWSNGNPVCTQKSTAKYNRKYSDSMPAAQEELALG